ncbi:hypothetical protein SNEBB_000275 [Seison nebaliae]|nr:hypothetical protein SNEBB_000275 [Seison nebaliae]
MGSSIKTVCIFFVIFLTNVEGELDNSLSNLFQALAANQLMESYDKRAVKSNRLNSKIKFYEQQADLLTKLLNGEDVSDDEKGMMHEDNINAEFLEMVKNKIEKLKSRKGRRRRH